MRLTVEDYYHWLDDCICRYNMYAMYVFVCIYTYVYKWYLMRRIVIIRGVCCCPGVTEGDAHVKTKGKKECRLCLVRQKPEPSIYFCSGQSLIQKEKGATWSWGKGNSGPNARDGLYIYIVEMRAQEMSCLVFYILYRMNLTDEKILKKVK